MDSDEFPNLNIGLLGAIFENILLFLVYYFFSFHISTSSVRLFSYEGA